MKIYYQIVFFIVLQYYRLRAKLVRPLKKPKNPNSVLYLAAFFPENAGYNWRVEKWAEILEENGFKVTIQYPLSEDEFHHLKQKSIPQFYIKYLRRRFRQVISSFQYETVIVRRELLLLNDYGDLFMEKLLLKHHPNAILDFDDDLSAAKNQPKEVHSMYGKLLAENGDKFNETLKRYNYFIVASDYLKKRILEVNNNVSEKNICVIPTCVDYDRFIPKQYSKENNEYTLGWIGGDQNQNLLKTLIPTLNRLNEKHKIKLIVIGGKPFETKSNFEIQNIKWNLNSEVNSLQLIDIGLMPLMKNEIAKGKGGLKLIQYMGLGIVSVASAITINKEIIEDKRNGFLIQADDDWFDVLDYILSGNINFNEIGNNARETITKQYTFSARTNDYLNFIEYVRSSNKN